MIEKPGRTFVLWVLALLLLLSAWYGFQRLAAALISWDTLLQLGLQPPPLYAVLSGGVWGLLSLVAALGLLTGRGWAPAFTRAAALILAAGYWLDRLALTRSPEAQANAPFAAALTALLLFYAFGVLALDRQKRYFHHGATESTEKKYKK